MTALPIRVHPVGSAIWARLSSGDRRELVKHLRRLGLSYSEIRRLVPVPKSTLSTWCTSIPLSLENEKLIASRSGPESRRGVPVNTQWRRHVDVSHIRREASQHFQLNRHDPLFIAGINLYWAEGSKTRNDLSMTNTDPRLLSIFVSFVRTHLDVNASFALALHLHHGDDETEAKAFWRSSLELPDARFTKTYIKPNGTGHRTKRLPHGVCRVRTDKASDHWHCVMQWIDDIVGLLCC